MRLLIAVTGKRLRELILERADLIEEDHADTEAKHRERTARAEAELAALPAALGYPIGYSPHDGVEDARRTVLRIVGQLRAVALLLDEGAAYEVNLDDLAQLHLLITPRMPTLLGGR